MSRLISPSSYFGFLGIGLLLICGLICRLIGCFWNDGKLHFWLGSCLNV